MSAPVMLNKPHGHDAILRAAGISRISPQGVVTSPADWESNNIVRAPLPLPIPIEGGKGQTVAGIPIHRNLSPSLAAVMAQIHRNHPESYAKLQFSGSFNPRPKRGQPNAFSLHSIGYAVDLNSQLYGFDPSRTWHVGDVVGWYRDVVNVFRAYGWKWGGDFGDVMHMQGADGY